MLLNDILSKIPSVHYVDMKSNKEALFKLLETNDHIVSFTKTLKIYPETIEKSFYVKETNMTYFEYEIREYSSIDIISDIDSNAIEVYVKFNDDQYCKKDTIITSALYNSNPPVIVFGFDGYIPDHVKMILIISSYKNGYVSIKDSALVKLKTLSTFNLSK